MREALWLARKEHETMDDWTRPTTGYHSLGPGPAHEDTVGALMAAGDARAEPVEHATVEECELVYRGHVAAPGYGVSYECSTCGRPWLRIGAEYVDPREGPYELRPEDVI
jgi:hypothetical protein